AATSVSKKGVSMRRLRSYRGGESRRVLVCALGLAAGACISRSAMGVTTLWIGTTGDWEDPANWSNGVPDAGTVAFVNNGGTAMNADSDVLTLNIGGLRNGVGTFGSVQESGFMNVQNLWVGKDNPGTFQNMQFANLTADQLFV